MRKSNPSQNERFRILLKQRGEAGVNSFEPVRMNFKQMSRIVDDLIKAGCLIESVDSKINQSTTYILRSSPKEFEKQGIDFIWDTNEKGNAYRRYL